MGGKKGKCCQGTYTEDTWTKPKEGRIEGGGRDGWGGVGGSGKGKMETTVLKPKFFKKI